MIYAHHSFRITLIIKHLLRPYLPYYDACVWRHHKFDFSCFDDCILIKLILCVILSIWLYAFKILKPLFWKGMHKLHQTSKWTHGTVVALCYVSWARTNNIAQNPLPCMIPVSLGHGDDFVRFVGTSEAAAMLFFYLEGQGRVFRCLCRSRTVYLIYSSSFSLSCITCVFSSVTIMAPVSPEWHLYHQGWKQWKVRTDMTSNPFPLVSANACELQHTLSHTTSIFSSQLPVLWI